LIVKEGWNTSSNKYKSLIDGNPMNIRINAGITVQNNSRGCDSVIFLFMEEFIINEFILNPTIVIIRIRIVIVWSWK